jgi:hypothetical protein
MSSRRTEKAPGAEKGGPLRPSSGACLMLTAHFEAFQPVIQTCLLKSRAS